MGSLIDRFLGGIKAYFGKEFRYYTITFLFFLVLLGLLAPLFMLLDVQAWNNIEMVYIIGSSSALVYLIYSLITLGRGMQKRFFETKWRYILGIIFPVGGTAGFSLMFILLSEIIPDLLYLILIVSLLASFIIWLLIQLFVFGLFIRDLDLGLINVIERNPQKKNKRLVIFAIIFQVVMIIYIFIFRISFTDISIAINNNLFPLPFNMWIFPIILTILSGLILIISLFKKKYQNAFFSTSYLLFYSFYLLYHVGYLILYIYKTELFIGTLNLMSLLIFVFILIYTLQSVGGQVKTKIEKWWQPISFFIFTIILLYITWSITFLYTLAVENWVNIDVLEIYFWGVNHLISYLFGVIVVIVTVFIFMARRKRKKREEFIQI
ncbi:MAG: hypothetical protein ACTSQI_18095 [Candidatus Helarchaeota archaeon]